MTQETKTVADKFQTFDKLDMRLGRIIKAETVDISRPGKPPLPHYKMTIDFGKFGTRTSVGRFTRHPLTDVEGRLIVGVLNFSPHTMGEHVSEVLVLGVQYPKGDSGEATFLTPLDPSPKIGGKVF